MPSFRKRHREPSDAPMPPPVQQNDSPVEQAGQAEIQRRLAEQQCAEEHVQQPPEPRMASEPEPQQQPQLPANVQAWLNEHPQFTRDRKQNLRLQLAHEEAAEAGVDVSHAGYLAALEERLGLNAAPPVPPTPAARDEMGGNYSSTAPVSREPPSMGGGRRLSEGSRLTVDEAAMARSLGLTQEQYRTQKEKMLRLKQSGALQA